MIFVCFLCVSSTHFISISLPHWYFFYLFILCAVHYDMYSIHFTWYIHIFIHNWNDVSAYLLLLSTECVGVCYPTKWFNNPMNAFLSRITFSCISPGRESQRFRFFFHSMFYLRFFLSNGGPSFFVAILFYCIFLHRKNIRQFLVFFFSSFYEHNSFNVRPPSQQRQNQVFVCYCRGNYSMILRFVHTAMMLNC